QLIGLARERLALAARLPRPARRLECGRSERAQQLDHVRAALDAADGLGDALAPPRADGDADQALEIRRDVAADGIGAFVRLRLDVVDLHVEVYGHAQPHVVDRLAGLALASTGAPRMH